MSGPESKKKNEPDVEDDPAVAASRASEQEDGSYVGRTFSDDDFDAGETGAEARARQGGD